MDGKGMKWAIYEWAIGISVFWVVWVRWRTHGTQGWFKLRPVHKVVENKEGRHHWTKGQAQHGCTAQEGSTRAQSTIAHDRVRLSTVAHQPKHQTRNGSLRSAHAVRRTLEAAFARGELRAKLLHLVQPDACSMVPWSALHVVCCMPHVAR